MKATRIFTLLLACVSFSGCSQQWTKPGITHESWARDDSHCDTQAALQFPVAMHTTTSPGYTAPLQTNCSPSYGGSVNCTTTGGETYPIVMTDDVNEDARARAWEACIRSRGYTRVR